MDIWPSPNKPPVVSPEYGANYLEKMRTLRLEIFSRRIDPYRGRLLRKTDIDGLEAER